MKQKLSMETAEQIVRDLEREREKLIDLMQESIDPDLLKNLIEVYGGGDSTVSSEKDLVVTKGTLYAGAH